MESDVLVGLDLGTTKICAIIAEPDDEGRIQVVGVGMTPSQGMRRGVVVNVDKTTQAISDAVSQAEKMAGVQAREVFVGIAGDHIRSINSRGIIAVTRGRKMGRNNQITQQDVDRVIEAARAMALPMDREVLHVIPQEFTVDEEKGVRDPIGLTGLRLEADVHIITGAVASAQNIFRCVQKAGLGVRSLVLEPLASSYSVLSEDEKELGVALIDLGGGTTDLAIFDQGSIRHTAVIGFGGTNVTLDIAKMLSIPIDTAERVKKEYGTIYTPESDSTTIKLEKAGDMQPIHIGRNQLSAIIRPRMEEIFEMVHRELLRVDRVNMLASGVVVTGGGAMLRGTTDLARGIFGLPSRIGAPRGLRGLADTVHNPAFATAVGLVLYGLEHNDAALAPEDDNDLFRRIISLFRGWFQSLME